MLGREGRDPVMPSGSSGFSGCCRTDKTHSACHEKRQDKVGAHWQYSASSEIMECSLGKNPMPGLSSKDGLKPTRYGEEKKRREYPRGTM